MSGKITDVILVLISEAEASDDLIRQLEADARPATAARIAARITDGRARGLSDAEIAAGIAAMLFKGEPLPDE